MPDIITRICTALAVLRGAVAFQAAREVPFVRTGAAPARTLFFNLIHARIGRAADRLARLWVRFQAGTLPKPRPSRAGKPRRYTPYPRLPGGHGWLLRAARPDADISEANGSLRLSAAGVGAQLRTLLAHPDIAAFLAAAPQAARILRPICTALAVTPLPPVLAPRPPTTRPDAAPAPRPATPPAPPTPRKTPADPPLRFSQT